MAGGIDYEIRTRFHPEPPTKEELESMKTLDPTLTGIFVNKLFTVASEGNETLIKLGATTGCRWGDTALAIYTTSGDIAVCNRLVFSCSPGLNRGEVHRETLAG
jgi:acetophenone carboxylase